MKKFKTYYIINAQNNTNNTSRKSTEVYDSRKQVVKRIKQYLEMKNFDFEIDIVLQGIPYSVYGYKKEKNSIYHFNYEKGDSHYRTIKQFENAIRPIMRSHAYENK